MSFFELGMLLCFGAAWPTAIVKSLRSKSTKGKSVGFLIIVLIGYILGILNKVLYHMDFVIAFYILNLCMVGLDTILFFRNRRYEAAQRTEKQSEAR
jgi:lipopolysaccharide export LptBFGC system permease protein LptF